MPRKALKLRNKPKKAKSISSKKTNIKKYKTISSLNKKVRELQKTLQKQIYFYKNLISKLPGSIYWKDKNFIYLGCNDTMAKQVGLKQNSDIVGLTDFDLSWRDKAQILIQNDKEVMLSNNIQVFEETGQLANGEIITVLTHKIPLTNEHGHVVGIVGTSLDITKVKELEKNLIDAVCSKSTFLSIASHEIKGPLSNSIYVLKKLEKIIEEDPTKTTALLPLIRDQIKDSGRGIDTINYLLDFLNLDLNTVSLKEPEEAPFGSRLVKIVDPYEKNYLNIEFHIDYDEKIPKVIFVPKGLENVIKILIANAVKYSQKNAFINLKAIDVVKNDQHFLKISVEDNGVGINKATLDRFFTPLLFEGMKDGERIYSAPAIKLSYIKKFTESLGGEFTIESEPDVGTTVTITVPYEKSDTDYQRFIPNSFKRYTRKERTTPDRALHFLIVEDNPLTLKLLKDEITKLGHYVDAAPNAHEAIKQAKETDYEVAFLDISLPGMDGVELKNKLTRKGGDFPIVIAITSHDSKIDKEYFYGKGFTAVIGKPFSKSDILDCVETIQRVLVDIATENEQKDADKNY